jgi:hypothetical protein
VGEHSEPAGCIVDLYLVGGFIQFVLDLAFDIEYGAGERRYWLNWQQAEIHEHDKNRLSFKWLMCEA